MQCEGRAATGKDTSMSELDIYRQQGFGHAVGFGRHPALVMIDFQIAFTDPAQYGGGNIADAVAAARELLAAFRAMKLPVAYSRVVYADDGADAGVFCRKAVGLEKLTETAPGGRIVPALAPAAGELVVRKTQPSAFFGTRLAAWLGGRGVDTVVIAGATTSGCVRATVVDAMSHEFLTIVARDGVGDRALAPHEANLFDMQQKYADVLFVAEILAHLKQLPTCPA
jgi:maleamate amidohydrolase